MKICKSLFLFAIFIISSCQVTKKVSCPVIDWAEPKTVTIEIPKYKRLVKLTSPEPAIEYRFWYKDSTVIFVSTEGGGSIINRSNIEPAGLWEKLIRTDSAVFDGQDANFLYWKEYRIKNIYVGYKNVNAKNKSEFDKALLTTKILKDTSR